MYELTQGYTKSSPVNIFFKFATPIFLVILFISLAAKITLNAKFLYYYDIDHLNIAKSVQMDKATIIKNYDLLIRYTDVSSIKELKLPDFTFSKSGLDHFKDVKNIFEKLDYAIIVSLILSIIGAAVCIKNNYVKFLKHGSLVLILLPILLAIPFMLNFNSSFIIFHKLLFTNDEWEFNPDTDPIINILPENFFMHCAFLLLGILVIFSILQFILYKILSRKAADY